MSNIPSLKKKLAAIIRAEMKKERAFFDRSCKILFKIIDKDITIEDTDKDQIKLERGRELWKIIYEPDYKKLVELIKKINEVNET